MKNFANDTFLNIPKIALFTAYELWQISFLTYERKTLNFCNQVTVHAGSSTILLLHIFWVGRMACWVQNKIVSIHLSNRKPRTKLAEQDKTFIREFQSKPSVIIPWRGAMLRVSCSSQPFWIYNNKLYIHKFPGESLLLKVSVNHNGLSPQQKSHWAKKIQM